MENSWTRSIFFAIDWTESLEATGGGKSREGIGFLIFRWATIMDVKGSIADYESAPYMTRMNIAAGKHRRPMTADHVRRASDVEGVDVLRRQTAVSAILLPLRSTPDYDFLHEFASGKAMADVKPRLGNHIPHGFEDRRRWNEVLAKRGVYRV